MVATYGTKTATRKGFGEALVELGKKNPFVVALSADVTSSVSVDGFAKAFPDRFVQVGIAEQNLITIAAGMSLTGLIPFAAAYSMFITGRPWDQIRNTVGYGNLNVKIVGSHSGVNVGPDGATHQSLEELALMRVIPHMTVIAPCDALETKKAVFSIAEKKGPCFLRLTRSPTPILTTESTPFEIGKAICLKEGTDVAIIACGTLVYEALLASDLLAKEGINARVYNMHTIKPIDQQAIITAAKECGCIVTAEDHQKYGGLGGAVAEVLTAHCPVPQEFVGVQDCFGESGENDELMVCFALKETHIVAAAKKAISRKKK